MLRWWAREVFRASTSQHAAPVFPSDFILKVECLIVDLVAGDSMYLSPADVYNSDITLGFWWHIANEWIGELYITGEPMENAFWTTVHRGYSGDSKTLRNGLSMFTIGVSL